MSTHGHVQGAHPAPECIDLLIDAYLDQTMTPVDRARFEDRLRTDADLRSALELARRVEESLRRSFRPPASIPLPIGATGAGVPPRVVRPRWVPWGAGLAALLAIAVGIRYLPMLRRGPGVPGGGGAAPLMARGDAALCLKSLQDRGFKPEWVCKDDAELARFTREQFGRAWSISPADGTTLVGWTYTPLLLNDNYARVLLAEYRGRRLALVVHEGQFDRSVKVPADGSLYAHRAVFDGLVAYELSPLPEPVILGRITTSE